MYLLLTASGPIGALEKASRVGRIGQEWGAGILALEFVLCVQLCWQRPPWSSSFKVSRSLSQAPLKFCIAARIQRAIRERNEHQQRQAARNFIFDPLDSAGEFCQLSRGFTRIESRSSPTTRSHHVLSLIGGAAAANLSACSCRCPKARGIIAGGSMQAIFEGAPLPS